MRSYYVIPTSERPAGAVCHGSYLSYRFSLQPFFGDDIQRIRIQFITTNIWIQARNSTSIDLTCLFSTLTWWCLKIASGWSLASQIWSRKPYRHCFPPWAIHAISHLIYFIKNAINNKYLRWPL